MSKIYNYKSAEGQLLEYGRPLDYPTPHENNQLFFIQRNQSYNAVVYNVNLNLDGLINLSNPMNIYWLKFDDNEEKSPLNKIQREIAYGYKHEVISNELIKFSFVSYKKDFFITKIDDNYKVVTKFNDKNYILESFYVHADQFGAFPIINYVEAHLIDMQMINREVIRMDLGNC
ncbi:MAG TPA: DUF4833 domain-containing protein [Saprospiraceae bacterium]|nr:DUF4833 domain-containing protein [Saprospiraceae bacterium]